jgi:hypothetical protein
MTLSIFPPFLLAIEFITGIKANNGKKHNIPLMNTLLSPSARTSFAKKKNWAKPVRKPYAPMMYPIVGGENPKPPMDMGIAKKRGRRTPRATLRRARRA